MGHSLIRMKRNGHIYSENKEIESLLYKESIDLVTLTIRM